MNIDIDSGFVKSVINFAQQNGGVKNNYCDDKYNSLEHTLAAQQLSYQYQQIAQNSQLLTGTEDKNKKKKEIGARLKRIPKKYTNAIVDSAISATVLMKNRFSK
jgi:hypothetical protein